MVAAPLTSDPYCDRAAEENNLVPEAGIDWAIGFCNTAGDTNLGIDEERGTMPPITTRHGDPGMVAYQCHGNNVGEMGTLKKGNGSVTSGVPFVAGTLRASASGVSRVGNGEEDMLIAFTCKDDGRDAGDLSPTLRTFSHDKGQPNGGGGQVAIAFTTQQEPKVSEDDTAFTVTADSPSGGGQRQCVAVAGPIYYSHQYNQDRVYGTGGLSEACTVARRPNFMTEAGVRRLTPRECERLQGFPDDFTLVPYRGKFAADGPRYRAIGNSMCVNVMRWIGERIAMVDAFLEAAA